MASGSGTSSTSWTSSSSPPGSTRSPARSLAIDIRGREGVRLVDTWLTARRRTSASRSPGSPTCSRSTARAIRRCSRTCPCRSSTTWSGSPTASSTSNASTITQFEPTEEAEQQWVEHVADTVRGHAVPRGRLVVAGREHRGQAPSLHVVRRGARRTSDAGATRSPRRATRGSGRQHDRARPPLVIV